METSALSVALASGVQSSASGATPTSFTFSVPAGTSQLSVKTSATSCTLTDVFAPGSTVADTILPGGLFVAGPLLGAIGAPAAGTWTFTMRVNNVQTACTTYSGNITVTFGTVVESVASNGSWAPDDGYAAGVQTSYPLWGLGTGAWIYMRHAVPAGQGVFQVDTTSFSALADYYLNAGTPPTLTSFYQGLKGGGGQMGYGEPAAGDYFVGAYIRGAVRPNDVSVTGQYQAFPVTPMTNGQNLTVTNSTYKYSFFRLDATGPSTLQAKVSSSGAINGPSLTARMPFPQATGAQCCTPTNGASLTATSGSAGPWYIAVAGQFTNASFNAKYSINAAPPPGLTETEPNDTMAQANPIASPNTYTGKVTCPGSSSIDQDWFVVSLQAGKQLNTTLSGVSTNYYSEIYNAAATLLAGPGSTLAYKNNGTTTQQIFVRVTGFINQCSVDQPYSINFKW